jgi:hypothetical protein
LVRGAAWGLGRERGDETDLGGTTAEEEEGVGEGTG